MASFAEVHFSLEDKETSLLWREPKEERSTNHFFDHYVMINGNSDASTADNFVRLDADSMLLESPLTSAEPGSRSSNPSSIDASQDVALSGSATHNNSQQPGSVGNLDGTTAPQPQNRCLRITLGHYERAEQSTAPVTCHEQPSGTSISDPELLELGGLSMLSPRAVLGHPLASAGVLPSSSYSLNSPHATQHSKAQRKRGRLESFYTTICKATTMKSKPTRQQRQVPSPISSADMDVGVGVSFECQLGPNKSDFLPRARGHSTTRKAATLRSKRKQQPVPLSISATRMDVDLDVGSDEEVSFKREPRSNLMDIFHRPCGHPQVFPCLTDTVPGTCCQQLRGGDSEFVAGYVEDPFLDSGGYLAPPALIHPQKMPNSPLEPPTLNGRASDGALYSSWTVAASASRRGGGPSSAPLPPPTEDGTIWAPAAHLEGDHTPPDDYSWHDAPIGKNKQSLGGDGSDAIPYTRAVEHASISLAAHMHQQQPHQDEPDDLAYDYALAASGLMIHMPQPRQPDSATAAATAALTTAAQAYQYPPPPVPALPQRHAPYSDHRRPRPRAPSSGARHHLLTSQRKPGDRAVPLLPAPSTSSTPSPTPSAHQRVASTHGFGSGPQSGSSSSSSSSGAPPPSPILDSTLPGSSSAVRERRSRSRRHSSGEPRTPIHNASASTVTPGRSRGRGRSSSAGNHSGGGRSAGFGFVNLTPDDGHVLMAGVAPSGSGKTKARREREAAERHRRLSEALARAMAVSGGDVKAFKERVGV